jgi:hypothetical protein
MRDEQAVYEGPKYHTTLEPRMAIPARFVSLIHGRASELSAPS